MRKRAVRAKATKPVKEAEVAENVEKTPEEYLKEILEEVKLGEKEAGRLLALKKSDGGQLLDLKNKAELFELMTRVQKFGFDGVYENISQGEYISLEHYFYDQMVKQKEIYVIKTLQKNIKTKAVEGLYDCPLCKKGGRKANNTRAITHYYRGDEPGFSKVTCLTCGHNWKDK